MAKINLLVVSQEKRLLEESVDYVTATTSLGEITILPGHIPLFTKLTTGELIYGNDKKSNSIIVSKGFLTIAQNNQVTVMADTAVEEREISVEKAKKAIKEAEETIKSSEDNRERIMAEAALRRALLEIRVAERSRRTRN